MRFLTLFTVSLPLFGAVSAATANPASTFADMQLLDYDERVEIYRDHPYAEQRAYWVGKVEIFKSEHLDSLNPEQKEVLNNAIRIFENAEELREEEPAMSRNFVAAFGFERAHKLIFTLYNEGEAGNISGNSAEDGQNVSAAPPHLHLQLYILRVVSRIFSRSAMCARS